MLEKHGIPLAGDPESPEEEDRGKKIKKSEEKEKEKEEKEKEKKPEPFSTESFYFHFMKFVRRVDLDLRVVNITWGNPSPYPSQPNIEGHCLHLQAAVMRGYFELLPQYKQLPLKLKQLDLDSSDLSDAVRTAINIDMQTVQARWMSFAEVLEMTTIKKADVEGG
eukprot:gene18722-6132_t